MNGNLAMEFPAGLRVLVVDDDPNYLRTMEIMLRNCLYEVTICNRAEIALKLLRDNRDGYDVVISEVHMLDMDGFKLLELVGIEMDLPIIMMSADDCKSVVIKAVTHGACDYLIKPVRVEALKNIWQHVVRKKKNEETGVVWSVELHQQFITAVNQFGIDKAVPKKIMELMNVPGLTRENVASHLQKYRLYLRRLSLSGVSLHPFGLGYSFVGPPDPGFGPMPSLNGLDFQALPLIDEGNISRFENPKQQLNNNGKKVNSNLQEHNDLCGAYCRIVKASLKMVIRMFKRVISGVKLVISQVMESRVNPTNERQCFFSEK